ncbi:MAG: tRNA (guanosine(37)-N1)-methyltransferase TrmD [Candidatus Doudnabacteria bacterium]|nr:tRNA (guanosine(37)-N1)-methyltransferase TrmD [Candidatus Doudnabacteria bacterium]
MLTLFPEAFESYFNISLIKRGLVKKFIDIKIVNLRDYTDDPHKTVDDRPYGGGAGMVLRVDIIDKALKALKIKKGTKDKLIVLLTPQGKKLDQNLVTKLAKYKTVCLICGRYEGFDERVRKLVDLELSLGDFVLTGGEVPAMAVVDAVSRLIPGFLGKAESLHEESFASGSLEYPQFTRPEVYNKMRVPKILLSGDHGKVKTWREQEALKKTKKRRPDLLK